MMKHQTTLVTGLATLLVAPPILFGDELQDTLEQALAGTVQAIEVVTGLQEKLTEDPEGAIPLVLSVTEAPDTSGQEQDERLSSLRQEVSLLQMQLDAMENPDVASTATGGSVLGTTTGNAGSSGTASAALLPRTQTGLSPSVRALLARNASPRTANPALQQTTRTVTAAPQPTVEKDSYSADPLGQAKASYRAGRFADGLVLLEGRTDGESMYWRARCLARLDRYDEAIETLTKVIALEGDSYTGKRAATDLEFFQWKRDFDKKLPGADAREEETR